MTTYEIARVAYSAVREYWKQHGEGMYSADDSTDPAQKLVLEVAFYLGNPYVNAIDWYCKNCKDDHTRSTEYLKLRKEQRVAKQLVCDVVRSLAKTVR